MKTKTIIIYTFQSLQDPLVKGLMLQYLMGLKMTGSTFKFQLITHEQKEFELTTSEIAAKKIELFTHNIQWRPVKYRSGSFLLLKKLFNFLQTFFIVLSVKLKNNPVAIMGFLSISGGYSYILSKLFHLKLIVYCFEPHSNYMIDFNLWSKTALKYKLLHRFEKLQLRHAHYIVVPNTFTKALVEQENKTVKIHVCPISIDTSQIVFNSAAREKIRRNINAENKTVVIYTGKFGGIYYASDVVIEFFYELYQADSKLFFYIITPNIEEVKQSISKFNLPESSYFISLTVEYTKLNEHVSAADIGFVALPSLPSQKYRTPVKTAIYLSCGIPYIINKNVGDDDIIAIHENIGIVIDSLEENPTQIVKRITHLLNTNPSDLKIRCRNHALNYRSTDTATSILNKIFSEIIN